jgi:hypothetical protein
MHARPIRGAMDLSGLTFYRPVGTCQRSRPFHSEGFAPLAIDGRPVGVGGLGRHPQPVCTPLPLHFLE